MVTNLVSRFGDAGLDLRLADRPIAFVGNTDIFQLDIRRAKKHDARSEYFLAWPGAPGNVQHIAGVDRRERQLVLVVREPTRAFEERVPNRLVAQTNGDRDALARRLALRPEV